MDKNGGVTQKSPRRREAPCWLSLHKSAPNCASSLGTLPSSFTAIKSRLADTIPKWACLLSLYMPFQVDKDDADSRKPFSNAKYFIVSVKHPLLASPPVILQFRILFFVFVFLYRLHIRQPHRLCKFYCRKEDIFCVHQSEKDLA